MPRHIVYLRVLKFIKVTQQLVDTNSWGVDRNTHTGAVAWGDTLHQYIREHPRSAVRLLEQSVVYDVEGAGGGQNVVVPSSAFAVHYNVDGDGGR